MIDFFFVLLFITIPLFAYKLLRLSYIRVSRVSIPSVVFISYLILAYAGFLPLYFHWDQSRATHMTDNELIFQLFCYSSISLLLIVFGFLYGAHVMRLGSAAKDSMITKPLKSTSKLIIAGLIFISCVLMVFYLKNLPKIPLLSAIAGDSAEALNRRSTMLTTNTLSGVLKTHHYRLFTFSIMSFITWVLFSNALVTRKVTAWVFVFIAFSVAAFGALVDTGKSPLLILIAGLFMTYLLTYNKRIKLRALFCVCTIIIVLSVGMANFFMHRARTDAKILLDYVFYRIPDGQIEPAYYCFKMFKNGNFLWGRSFPNPHGILPFEFYDLDVAVWAEINHAFSNSSIMYSAPAVYWSDLNANFGLFGTVIVSPLLGLFFYLVHSFLKKLPAHPIKAALICWCAMNFSGISQRSIGFLIFNDDLLAILLVSFFVLMVEGGGTIKLRHSVESLRLKRSYCR